MPDFNFNGPPPRITRATGGRGRGTMQELLAAGELLPGEPLTAEVAGQVFHATVRDDGRIETAGQVCDSPTEACDRAGVGHTDGWEAWVCVRDDETLATKRWRIGRAPS